MPVLDKPLMVKGGQRPFIHVRPTYLNLSAHCICSNFASCPSSITEKKYQRSFTERFCQQLSWEMFSLSFGTRLGSEDKMHVTKLQLLGF